MGRDERKVGPGNIDIIPEDPVVPDLEGFDTGLLPFLFLELHNPVPAGVEDRMDSIEFRRKPRPDNPAIAGNRRRLLNNRPTDQGNGVRKVPHIPECIVKKGRDVIALFRVDRTFQCWQGGKGICKGKQVPRPGIPV